jgi:hypothetical protein
MQQHHTEYLPPPAGGRRLSICKRAVLTIIGSVPFQCALLFISYIARSTRITVAYLLIVMITVMISLLSSLPVWLPLIPRIISLFQWCHHNIERWCSGGVRFLILSTPRSGSTLLVNIMASHPRIKCRGEILNKLYEWYPDVSQSSPIRRLLHVATMLAGDVLSEMKGYDARHQFPFFFFSLP